MNKLICILLALLVLVFCFASCKNKNEGAENVEDESQNENKNDETVEEKPSEDIVATPTEGILYDISNDGSYAMVTGYDGAEKNVIIADIFEGLPVTKICSYAFCGSEISSITISDNITHIEGYAFTNCDSLSSLTIGKSVNYIGAYAFHQCIALEQFYFNAAVLDDFICSNNSF